MVLRRRQFWLNSYLTLKCDTTELNSLQIEDYLKHKDEYDAVIFYEDIVSDAESVCKKLFDLSNTDYKYVPQALEALKTDSQKGTFGLRGAKPKTPPEVERSCNELLKEYGIPLSTDMSVDDFKKVLS